MTDALPRLTAALANRYRIEREVGHGGMATVYLAHDLKHGRQVAIKVLRPELAAAIGAERFLHEIEVTAGLQHPHILPLFDSGEADGLLFYVMPFVEGESLRDRLARDGRLPISQALAIAGDVAAALSAAHARGSAPTETADWRRERLWIDGIGGDSVLIYLYLPKRSPPPFQTLVFVASSGAFFFEPVWQTVERDLGPRGPSRPP